MKDQDPRTVALDNVAKTGSKKVLKAAVAFQAHPEKWMSIQDVATIVGQSPNTVKYHSVRELFNAQIVTRKYTYDSQLEPTALYRLNVADREIDKLLEKKRAKSSKVKEDIGAEPESQPKKPKTQLKSPKSQLKSNLGIKDIQESPTSKTQSESKPKTKLKKPKTNPSSNPRSDPRTGDRLEIKAKREDPPPEVSPKNGGTLNVF